MEHGDDVGVEKKAQYDIFIINCMQIIETWKFVFGSFDRYIPVFWGMKHTLEGSSSVFGIMSKRLYFLSTLPKPSTWP
jgi:hypothetical protein